MKYLPFIIVGVAVILAAFLIAGLRFQNGGVTHHVNEVVTALSGRFESQTNSEGAVMVTVVPESILESGSWEFKVTLDTHSGALDEDMVAVSVLIDDAGKEYAPTEWEDDPAGGHHREGILKFKALAPKSETIRIVIRGIGGIKERVFMWRMSPRSKVE